MLHFFGLSISLSLKLLNRKQLAAIKATVVVEEIVEAIQGSEAGRCLCKLVFTGYISICHRYCVAVLIKREKF